MQNSSLTTLQPELYSHRFYRDIIHTGDGATFRIREGESDLWVHTDAQREEIARRALLESREMLMDYIEIHPVFKTSLTPISARHPCPNPIDVMIRRSRTVGVGPMAGVAGMVARYVGEALVSDGASHVLVENGGDIFIYRPHFPTTIGLFAGQSPLSLKIGIKIPPYPGPIGVATSSGTVGPSLSFGKADAVCVLSHDAILADTTATAVANRIQAPEDMEKALSWGASIKEITGIIAIVQSALAAWGAVELIKL